MADIRVIKYGAGPHKSEHDPSVDSVQFASFKTATFELTDSDLGNLVGGADANDVHTHDGRYFAEGEFINTSAGAGDAGKPIILDASGLIDNTMIDGASLSSEIDHGSLLGLADDDHPQYLLVDGTRAMTGALDMGSNLISNVTDPVSAQDAATKAYVDNVAEGLAPKEAVDLATTGNITLSGEQTIDGTLTSSSRVLVKDQTTASENGIYITGSGAWTRATDFDETTPINEIDGAYVPVIGGTDNEGKFFVQSESVSTIGTDDINFVFFNAVASGVTGGDGIDVTTGVVSVDLLTGGGLKIDTAQLAIEPNDFAGAGLVDDGSDNLAVDFANPTIAADLDGTNPDKVIRAEDLTSTANGEGASLIGVEDTNGYFTGDNQEAVNDELYALAIAGGGVSYTAGTGGVAAGDLVYVDSNDTILPYSDISIDEFCVGIALEAASAGNPAKVARFDKELAGVLTSAVAGDEYYWDGSTFTATKPSTSGDNVWMVGIAKNATDLALEVRHLYKVV